MIGAIIAVPLAKQQYYGSVKPDQIGPMVVRGLAGTISFITLALAVNRIPLSINQSIMNSMPFMVAILAFVWLREALTLFELVAMCCCFGGITIVAFG